MAAPVRGVALALLVLCSLALTSLPAATGAEATEKGQKDAGMETYRSLFYLKRREHVQAVEDLMVAESYEKQYKTVSIVMEAIFPILSESLAKIESAGYVAGSAFPQELEMKEVLGKVYENVAFFGDFLLRLPDITKKIYKRHKEWHGIFESAILFCNESKEIFSGPHATQLHLMAQEMGIIPQEPNYHNPFRVDAKVDRDKEPYDPRNMKARGENSAPNKVAPKRGPRLRGARHTEL